MHSLSFSLQSSQVLSDSYWDANVVFKLSMYLCDFDIFYAGVFGRIRVMGI